MSSDRTIYSITNELKTYSTISVFKLDADALQETVENVHEFVQKTYDLVLKHYPKLSRKKRGNLVRYFLTQKAVNSPIYLKRINQFL